MNGLKLLLREQDLPSVLVLVPQPLSILMKRTDSFAVVIRHGGVRTLQRRIDTVFGDMLKEFAIFGVNLIELLAVRHSPDGAADGWAKERAEASANDGQSAVHHKRVESKDWLGGVGFERSEICDSSGKTEESSRNSRNCLPSMSTPSDRQVFRPCQQRL